MGLLTGVAKTWPGITPKSQTIVEATAIAVALVVGRKHLWDPLSAAERNSVAAWLLQVNGAEVHSNNWQMFPGVVNAALCALDVEYSESSLEDVVRRVDAMYLGDGWYGDGAANQIDYYNAWAFHFYPPLVAMFTNDDKLKARYGERVDQFLVSYAQWFDNQARSVPYGRSLLYRFANVTPFWVRSLLNPSATSQAEHRRYAEQIVGQFLPGLCDDSGLVTTGWLAQNDAMAQEYSCRASNYWVSKALGALMLGPSSLFWGAESEESEPQAVPPGVSTPLQLVTKSEASGVSVLQPCGATHAYLGDDPHYRKLAYTSVSPVVDDASGELRITSAGVRRPRIARSGCVVSEQMGVEDLLIRWRLPKQRLDKAVGEKLPWLQRVQVLKVAVKTGWVWAVRVVNRMPSAILELSTPSIPGTLQVVTSSELGTVIQSDFASLATGLPLNLDGPLAVSSEASNGFGKGHTYLQFRQHLQLGTNTCVLAWNVATGSEVAPVLLSAEVTAADSVWVTSGADAFRLTFGARPSISWQEPLSASVSE